MSVIYKRPTKFFEEQGVVSPDHCYFVSLDNVGNTKNQDIKTMVDIGRYFTIFAPRQSGKTTFFINFCRLLEKDPLYIPILLSFQTCQKLSSTEFYENIHSNIKEQTTDRLKKLNCKELGDVIKCFNDFIITNHNSFYKLFKNLNDIIHQKKIIIFIDEFDGIPLSELENFLMVLRDLYQNYKHTQKKALYSVGLVGIRNIAKLVVGGVSPFNIADQVNLPMFSFTNVKNLYGQYTQETNQPFSDEAVQLIYEQTYGQPWLVNRLGTILTVNIKPNTTDIILPKDVDMAINRLLKEDNAHFDNLYEKALLYKETFVNLYHQDIDYDPNDMGQAWLKQYGLIKEMNGKAIIANPVYKKRFATISKQHISNIVQPKMDGHENKPLIFLCHAKEDIEFVRSLYHRLKQENLTPWLDEIDIFPGQNWDIEIQRAIKKTDFALICLSSISVQKKGYLHKEIKWALDRQSEMPEVDIFVIPVKIEPCILENRLAGIHSVDLFETSGFEKLIQSIRYQVQKNGKAVKGQNKNLQQPNDLIQQLKQGINKLSLNHQDKEDINIQINILEAQLKSNRKHVSIIKAVIETIHYLIKDTADNDLVKVMDQIKRVME
jgi:hypothetical protein